MARVEVRRATIIQAPIEQVWAILRDFNGHENWHPAVASSEIEHGAQGDHVGAVRCFQLGDGGRIREQLLALSDHETSFAYCILEAPVFLRGYVSHVRLRPVTEDNACFWEWRASFDPRPSERESLKRFIAEDIMAAGFRAIRDHFARGGGKPAAKVAPSVSVEPGAEATAVILTRYGGPDVLETRKIRVAKPGPGQVRIRQTAIGVNFIDVYCRRGSFDLVTPPGIPGMEAAGVVESAGSGVGHLKPGDRIAYACAPPGSYTSLRTMRADLLVPLPPFLSDEAAASILLKGVTAGFLLHDVHSVRRGDVVLVHAAAGGVGQLLCRWAKALGAIVIGSTSSEAKAEHVKRLGCDHVIVSSRENFADAAMRLTQDRGADVVYDAIGKDTFEDSIRALVPRGHLVSFGQASGDVGAYSIDRLSGRSITLSRPNYGDYTDTAAKMKSQAERLFAALRSGIVTPESPRRYSLNDARAAHADL